MLVATGIPIAPNERMRRQMGPTSRSMLSCSVAHFPQEKAQVGGDSNVEKDNMDGGSPPSNHPTQRGRPSTHEVGESSLRRGGCPPWMNILLREIEVMIDQQFNKIEEQIRELRRDHT